MCGICGIYNPRGIDDADTGAIGPMTDVLAHRGPDDSGVHADGFAALGHRRLSIIDLSFGAQPMSNEDGSVWTAFNGEIYNFKSVREDLIAKGHVFKTNSDTEVIVHGWEEFGADVAAKLDGMFALAVWDASRRMLLLARDRAGKKPLYYTTAPGGRFIFASEIKSLLLHPMVERRLNHASLHHTLSFQHVPGEDTIFTGIKKLPPAHLLLIGKDKQPPRRYWFPNDVRCLSAPAAKRAAAELPGLIREAVRARLMSDVPLGAFLSGGIDSSAVVAMMAQTANSDIHTFSIGFDTPEFDETAHARAVSEQFGTKHTEFIVTSKQLLEAVPMLVWNCDEPTPDSSILPTYCLSLMTRKHVTVALSGDGGDELFAGYERYLADRYLHNLASMPEAARKKLLAPALGAASRTLRGKISHRLSQLAELAPYSDAQRHLNWLSFFTEQEKDSLFSADFAASVRGVPSSDIMQRRFDETDGGNRDFTARQLLVDFLTYLPETVLMKVDRASMACSLEVRCPLLDTRIIELALSIPGGMKIARNTTKRVLKEALRGTLPDDILDRRKQGFEVPLNTWFRGPLRDALRDYLTDDTAKARGIFDPAAVETLIEEHLSEKRDNRHRLWILLNIELWFRTFIDGAPPAEPGRLL